MKSCRKSGGSSLPDASLMVAVSESLSGFMPVSESQAGTRKDEMTSTGASSFLSQTCAGSFLFPACASVHFQCHCKGSSERQRCHDDRQAAVGETIPYNYRAISIERFPSFLPEPGHGNPLPANCSLFRRVKDKAPLAFPGTLLA